MRILLAAAVTFTLANFGMLQAANAEAAKPPVVEVNVADPTHEMCKSVMDKKMRATYTHQHTGKMNPADMKARPLTKKEMDKVHAKCMAKLAQAPKN